MDSFFYREENAALRAKLSKKKASACQRDSTEANGDPAGEPGQEPKGDIPAVHHLSRAAMNASCNVP